MIRRHLFKTFALGLGMTALFVGAPNLETAYASSGGGSSAAYVGTINMEDNALYDKQKEMDQYLFVDHAQEIEKLKFKIIYTGVADNYVEVGITPYSDENAKYLYDIFGDEIVKVVDTQEVELYTTPVEDLDVVMPSAPNQASPIMDMGDKSVSDISAEEETKIKESEQDEDEKLTIQIESIGDSEQIEAMDPELIWQTTVAEDQPSSDNTDEILENADEILENEEDLGIVSAEDDMVKTTGVADVENEVNKLPTASVIAAVAGGIIIVGGIVAASTKKKSLKNDKYKY